MNDFIADINRTLEHIITESTAGIHPHDTYLSTLLEHTKHVITHGGKRIRPSLICLVNDPDNETISEDVYRLAAGIELFHAFCLIHDDIMDHAETRHGVTTLHKKAEELLLARNINQDNIAHQSMSQAILLGDFVFGWAQAAVMEAANGNQVVKQEWRNMVNDVVLGQMKDIDFLVRDSVSMNHIRERTRLKTASYTFVRPLNIGCAYAKTLDDVRANWNESFGTAIGIAFQFQDDLLDTIGDQSKTKKKVLQDLREGQHTPITAFVFEQCNAEQKQTFMQWFKNTDLTVNDQPTIISWLTDVGAIDYVESVIHKHFDTAERLLQDSPYTKHQTLQLEKLVHKLKHRSA